MKKSDLKIHEHLLKIRGLEKQVLGEILERLRMVDERRLYCDFKYGSLYTYAIKALGYSEGEAYRRVKASRLLKDFPEVKEKIQKGRLTLTNAAILEGFFKNSSKKLSEKRSLIKACEGKSSREVTHILSPPNPSKKKDSHCPGR